jgi:Major Facilitator Superfamily
MKQRTSTDRAWLLSGFFNLGTVLGMAATPLVTLAVPWPLGFGAVGGVCAAFAALCTLRYLPSLHAFPAGSEQMASAADALRESAHSHKVAAPRPLPSGHVAALHRTAAHLDSLARERVKDLGGQIEEESTSGAEAAKEMNWLSRAPECFALIWAHSAIGFGFFTFQNWIPTYLQHVADPIARGALAALPWAASAVLSFATGSAFAALRRRGMSAYRSQTLAHTVACLGAAAALVPLAMPTAIGAGAALACMSGAVALQTCNYSGFHSYVQTNGAMRAGSLLAVTNSCGIIAGAIANLAMGVLLSATGSYASMFAATAAIYVSSWLVWLVLLRGRSLVAEPSGL